jgi:hypothetical protein
MLGELQLVEKKVNGGNPAVPGNDEISTSVCWCLARAAQYPLDPARHCPFPPRRLLADIESQGE